MFIEIVEIDTTKQTPRSFMPSSAVPNNFTMQNTITFIVLDDDVMFENKKKNTESIIIL